MYVGIMLLEQTDSKWTVALQCHNYYYRHEILFSCNGAALQLKIIIYKLLATFSTTAADKKEREHLHKLVRSGPRVVI